MQDNATHLQILIGEKIAQQEDLNIEHDKICIALKECECKRAEIADQIKNLQSELEGIEKQNIPTNPNAAITILEEELILAKSEYENYTTKAMHTTSFSEGIALSKKRNKAFRKYKEIQSALLDLQFKNLHQSIERNREIIECRMGDGTIHTTRGGENDEYLHLSQIESTLPSGIKIKLSFNRQINMKEYGDIMQMIINLSEVTVTGNDKIELKLPSITN